MSMKVPTGLLTKVSPSPHPAETLTTKQPRLQFSVFWSVMERWFTRTSKTWMSCVRERTLTAWDEHDQCVIVNAISL